MAPKNRPEELRELKTEELTQKLDILSEERFRLEFRRATEALTNPLTAQERVAVERAVVAAGKHCPGSEVEL